MNINIGNKVKARQGVLAAIILIVSMAPCSTFADSTTPPRVWFTPRDNLARPGFYAGSPDFMNLFGPNAPWTQAASHVQVFKIYPQFVLSASDADLRTVIVGLQQRNIALALEFGLLTNRTLCGKIEGYCGEQIGPAAARIKALGGTLAYVAMDEPLWFGHFSTQPGALQTPIAAIAKDVANQVATIHRYFPHAQVGDIEPLLGATAPPNYVDEILGWMNAYEQAVGIPFAFFHVELNDESTELQTQLSQLSAEMRSNGTKFGIIYNGSLSDTTGPAWTTDAEALFVWVEQNQAMVSDDAVLQTWEIQPDHALPETQPGTMTYLVNRYAAAETTLSANQISNNFSGRITSQGSPLSNAQISAYVITQTGWQLIWAGPTNASGMFALKLPAPVPVVKFNFSGDSTHRLSSALVTTP